MAFPWLAVQFGITGGLLLWRGLTWLDGKISGKAPTPKPRPDDLEFPQLAAGTPIPLIYGTVRVDSPILAWWGNVETEELHVEGVYSYGADLVYVLGTPPWDDIAAPWGDWRATRPPRLHGFWIGDRRVTFGSPLLHGQSTTAVVGNPDGDDFIGRIQFFDGRDGQQLSGLAVDALTRAGVPPQKIAGFAHQMLAIVSTSTATGYMGLKPRLPAISFEVEALGPNPIGQDANPAFVAYDIMRAPVWRMGLEAVEVDLPSFTAAMSTLVDEEHGISLIVSQPDEAMRILADITSQVDAVIFEDAATSKITARLIRADYNPGALPVMTHANTVGGQHRPRITATGWYGAATQVDVLFTNRANHYKRDPVSAPRLGNAAAASFKRNVKQAAFPGCTNRELAGRLAARETALLGRPILSCVARLNREFYDVLPGDVLVANWPDYHVTNKVFRVISANYGQLAAGAIEVLLVEDVFDRVEGGFPGTDTPELPFLLPLHERYLTEAPRWMLQKLYNAGVINSPDVQRILAVPVNPDDPRTTHARAYGTPPLNPNAPLIGDTPGSTSLMFHARTAEDYPRTAEPYDTATGLLLDEVSDDLAAVLAGNTATNPSTSSGVNLSVLFDADGNHEFLAWRAVAAEGGGYRLSDIWRGLLDTAPRDWPAGSRYVLLSLGYTADVGRLGRAEGDAIDVQMLPTGSGLTGSGDDPIDTITIEGRTHKPLPAADLELYGAELEGTQGIPATSGRYKAVSHLEGDAFVSAAARSRLTPTITRGDAASETVEAGTTWSVHAERQNIGEQPDEEVTVASGLSTPEAQHVLLGRAGHGTIDVRLRSHLGGRRSWTDPTVRVEAPSWRNLLANGQARLADTTIPSASGWTNVQGTIGAEQGAQSLSRSPTGTYFAALTAVGDGSGKESSTSFRQTVDVSGYAPRGLSAVCELYLRDGGSGDAASIELQPLSASSAPIGSPTTLPKTGAPTTTWRRVSLSIPSLPAGTAQIRVTIALTRAGTATPTMLVSDISLRLGHATAQLLDNPTFDQPGIEALVVGASFASSIANKSEPTQFSIEMASHGTDAAFLQTVIDIDSAVTCSMPTEVSKIPSTGWDGMIWIANPEPGVQWRAHYNRTSLAAETPAMITFSTTPTTEGALGLSVSGSASPGLADSDTASATVVTPALIGSTSAAPNPTGVDGATVTLHVEVTGNQTGLAFFVDAFSPDGLSPLPSFTLLDGDGWTVTPNGTGYDCTLASASHGDAFDLTFALGGSMGGGTVQVFVEDFLSDQVVSGTWDLYDVEYEASAPAWTVDATSGMAVPADATEFTAWRTASGLANWSNPASLYLFQESSGSIADKIGSLDLSAFGSGHVYAQSVSGWARTFAFMTDGVTGCYRTLDASLPDISTTSCLIAAWVRMPATAPAGIRNFLALGSGATARITTTPRIGSASGSNPATGTVDPSGKTMLVFLQVDRTNGVQRVITPDEVITPTLGTVSGKLTCFGSTAGAASTGYGWAGRWDGAAAERSLADFHAFYVAAGVTPAWSP